MREAQSSSVRLLHAHGIPVDIIEDYDCIPVRLRHRGNCVKLQTMFGARAVRAVGGDSHQVQRSFAVTEYLARQGHPRCPRFIRNRYGDPYIHDGNRYYYMTDWIPGRDVDPANREELLGAMKSLAVWHKAVKGALSLGEVALPERCIRLASHESSDLSAACSPMDASEAQWTAGESSYSSQLVALRDATQSLWDVVRASRRHTEFEKLFAGFARTILVEAQDAIQGLDELQWRQFEQNLAAEGWIRHGNFHARQMRFDGEHYTVVDYRYVEPGCPLTDVASFLDWHMPAHEWDENLTLEAIRTYLQELGEPTWEGYLTGVLTVPWSILQLIQQYQVHNPKDEVDFVDRLETALEQAAAKRKALGAVEKEVRIVHSGTRERAPASEGERITVNPGQDSDGCHELQELHELQEPKTGDELQVVVEGTRSQDAIDQESRNNHQGHTTDGESVLDAVLASEKLRIRPYRPRVRRGRVQGASRASKSQTGAQIRLWGDAQNPGD